VAEFEKAGSSTTAAEVHGPVKPSERGVARVARALSGPSRRLPVGSAHLDLTLDPTSSFHRVGGYQFHLRCESCCAMSSRQRCGALVVINAVLPYVRLLDLSAGLRFGRSSSLFCTCFAVGGDWFLAFMSSPTRTSHPGTVHRFRPGWLPSRSPRHCSTCTVPPPPALSSS